MRVRADGPAPSAPRASAGAARAALRDPAVDAFRGLAVLLMALGNFELGVRVFPAWLKHTPDVGYTIADLVAPMFVVAMATTVGPSMRRRRESDGAAAAYRHLATRALALIGIGAVISAGQAIVQPVAGVTQVWGVLQTLGVASLMLMPVVFAPAAVRVLAGVGCLAAYQWLFANYWSDVVVGSPHNGLAGTLSWGGLLMISTAVADAVRAVRDPRRQTRLFVLAGLAGTGAALLLLPCVEVSKTRASATYMLLSLGLSLLVLAGLGWVLLNGATRLLWLRRVGRNALLLYLANLLLLAVFELPGVDWWYAGAPLWLSLTQAAVIAAFTLDLADRLDRRGIVVAL